VLGTGGYLEVRKNVDPAGRPGADHVILVDAKETRHVDCSRDRLEFGSELLAAVTAGRLEPDEQERTFRAQELALEAQARAVRLA
jgi:hypothetical protein